MHIASKCLWPRSLKTEVVSHPIIASTLAWVPHEVLGLHVLIPLVGLIARLGYRTPLRMTQLGMGQNPSR
jgi:hypothetical protein